jgi:hypothetical protein
VELSRRHHADGPALGSPQVRVSEWREVDLATIHLLPGSADGGIRYLVVDGIVAREPVSDERCSGRPGRLGPAEQPLPKPPEVLLGSVDGFLSSHRIVRRFGRSYRSSQLLQGAREFTPLGFTEVIFRSRRGTYRHKLHLKAGRNESGERSAAAAVSGVQPRCSPPTLLPITTANRGF